MRFSIRPAGAHLEVDVSGPATKSEWQAMFEKVGESMRDGRVRALIELHVDECLDSLDTLDVVTAIPRLGLRADYRIALLVESDAMRPSAEFAETVAVNRGIPVRTFDQRGPALTWLDA
jgi:hypothetical protein